jgi:hypothetical protein
MELSSAAAAPTSSSSGRPPVLGVSSMALEFGLPMNPLEGGADADADATADGTSEEEANRQVLSTSQELRREARSEGSKMLVRVTTLEMTSSRLFTLVVEALKKVVK